MRRPYEAISQSEPARSTSIRRSFPSLRAEILRAVLGIAARASVAHADVELAVGAERELAAVVVRVRLVDPEELADLLRRGRPSAVLDHARVAVRVRVVDVEQPVGCVVRVEGDRQQALLATALDEGGDVEERASEHAPVLDDTDPSCLLDDVEPPLLSGRRGDVHRRLEARSDAHQPEL